MRRPARARERAGTGTGLVATLLVHGAAAALLLVSVTPAASLPPVYAVELVAAPAPSTLKRIATEAVSRAAPSSPAPSAEPVAPTEQAVALGKAKPKPSAASTTRREPDRETAPPTRSTATPLPGETPGTGADAVNLRTPGLEFAYPEYLRNILNAVYRRWGTPSAALSCEVSFLIMRDGSVRDIRFVRRSGNFNFDLEAQGAIEAAGRAGDFGPLPAGWPADVLPVSFVFEPRR